MASDSEAPRATSSLPRTLPLTWTTSVTPTGVASSGSNAGHADSTRNPFSPKRRHHSSVRCGAIGWSSWRSVRAAARSVAGVSTPSSSASAIPRWNSISAAIAVWKWKRRASSRDALDRAVRQARERRVPRPVGRPGRAACSWTRAQRSWTRLRNR